MATFTLSIEPVEGRSFMHPYHLGTIESVARDCAVNIFKSRNSSPYAKDHKGRCMTVRTVALIKEGKMFDCFMGDKWSSDYSLED